LLLDEVLHGSLWGLPEGQGYGMEAWMSKGWCRGYRSRPRILMEERGYDKDGLRTWQHEDGGLQGLWRRARNRMRTRSVWEVW
jgi:hypothetical protein